jgi:hypothetical protein
MATLPDLTSFDHWQSETAGAALTLPIRGKSYMWRTGDLSLWGMLTLQRLEQKMRDLTARKARGDDVDPTELALTTAEQRRLDRDLLGDNLDQMVADGVKWAEALHVSATLLTWHLRGEDAAKAKWARTEEKPADPPAPAASTKTAGSSTRSKATARSRSAGRTSSPTGTSSKRTSTGSTKSTSLTKKSPARGPRAGS